MIKINNIFKITMKRMKKLGIIGNIIAACISAILIFFGISVLTAIPTFVVTKDIISSDMFWLDILLTFAIATPMLIITSMSKIALAVIVFIGMISIINEIVVKHDIIEAQNSAI